MGTRDYEEDEVVGGEDPLDTIKRLAQQMRGMAVDMHDAVDEIAQKRDRRYAERSLNRREEDL